MIVLSLWFIFKSVCASRTYLLYISGSPSVLTSLDLNKALVRSQLLEICQGQTNPKLVYEAWNEFEVPIQIPVRLRIWAVLRNTLRGSF